MPTYNISLSVWKVTLPVDNAGGFTGTAKEIVQPTASVPPYFVLNADGSILFSAPVNGATTSGSHYPRCELRELTTSGANIAWKVSQGGHLNCTLKVIQLPVKSTGGPGRVVVGQIHGPNDELSRLYYDNGQLYTVNDKAGSTQTETTFILRDSGGNATNIPLNEKFSYTIQVFGATRRIVVTATDKNGIKYTSDQPVGPFWTESQNLYYKAGIYVQVGKPGSGAGTVGSGTGTNEFYHIEVGHGLTTPVVFPVTDSPEDPPVPPPTNTQYPKQYYHW